MNTIEKSGTSLHIYWEISTGNLRESIQFYVWLMTIDKGIPGNKSSYLLMIMRGKLKGLKNDYQDYIFENDEMKQMIRSGF